LKEKIWEHRPSFCKAVLTGLLVVDCCGCEVVCKEFSMLENRNILFLLSSPVQELFLVLFYCCEPDSKEQKI